jgi:hypothetical protein
VRLVPILCLAVVVLAVPMATTAAAPGKFRVVSITTSSRVTDKAPSGASAGDTYVTTSRLVNAARQFGKAKGAVVGSDRATTTLTAPRKARVDGRVTLPGGTLTVRGALKEQGASFVAPVVGGTGAFRGARGTVTITGTDKRATNTYALSY